MTQHNPPCLPWEFYGWAGAAFSYAPKAATYLCGSEDVKHYKRTGEARYPATAVCKQKLYHFQGWERLTWVWPAHRREDVRR